MLFRMYAIIHIVLLSCLLATCGAEVVGEINRTTLQDYLAELGAQLDCYFTVESVGRSGDHQNPILDGLVNLEAKAVDDVDAALSFLNNDVEIMSVDMGKTNTIRLVAEKFEGNDQIIMIRDNRLSRVENYALTNKVSVTCNGTPLYLLSRLSVKEPLIKIHDRFRLSKSSSMDRSTPIKVCATNESIRTMITTCVPLEEYSRVIWSADTNGKDDSPEIRVEFYGKRPKKSLKDCLLELGNKFDCYFTVEGVEYPGFLRKHIDAELISVHELENALDFLTNEFVYERYSSGKTNIVRFIAEKDECCNEVIRICDTRLMAVTNYVLNKKITLAYNGSPFGLIELLSTKDQMIQHSTVSLARDYMHGYMGNDIVTPIEVGQTNVSIRNVLTAGIPLEGYNRIVWISYTDGNEASPIVKVGFYGKARRPNMTYKIRKGVTH